MPKPKGKHLSKENREVIEIGIRNHDSARAIAKRLDVNASTVTREVKTNRTIREKKAARGAKLSIRCSEYRDCEACGTACEKCSTKLTLCKNCKTRNCIETCSSYKRTMCEKTEIWPYVCPEHCFKRAHCGFPKASYDAGDADNAYCLRLRVSRNGRDISQSDLNAMNKLILPLVKQGQSFETIWESHAKELPICVRSAYNYQDDGILETANIELPRKVRIKKRKNNDTEKRDRIDRTGRTYDDFRKISLIDQARVVQGDSIEGYEYNTHDILSLHIVSRCFQFYLYKKHACSDGVVAWLDAIERSLGSRELFESIFGILLVDRGIEFDNWEGMERSCLEPGKRRCRVFYCDAMNSNQKSEAERNHQQLRRILPKGRSDFDRLNTYDVSTCCSHVNSYIIAGRGGKCPFGMSTDLLPKKLLEDLGLEWMEPDDVILKPFLMSHAVEQ